MKIEIKHPKKTIIDSITLDVGLYFDKDGIYAMIGSDEIPGHETIDRLISWDDVLDWAQASSQEEPDCENIILALRDVANKLEDWLSESGPINYPSLSKQDLRIADLERENDAAFEKIKELSEALVALGYDPTSKRLPDHSEVTD